MLIASRASREDNRLALTEQFRRPRVPLHLSIEQSRLNLESMPWAEYWRPCRPFLGADFRLIQRLNRLKKAWVDVIRRPASCLCRSTYCWRYFGLLHHALQTALEEPRRAGAMTTIRRILAFEVFSLGVLGEHGTAAGTVSNRNPVFLLGQLGRDPRVLTPRHIPLLLPLGCDEPFYHYRQMLISSRPGRSLLVSPAVNLPNRAESFAPIDRLTRLLIERADPFWKPRARLLAKRLLVPLLRARSGLTEFATSPLQVLDLGAGTGQLLAKAWTYLAQMSSKALPAAAFHFVDACPPTLGRSFGLTRNREGVAHVEWTTADYRALIDNDRWLQTNGPFDWVFACRLFDNSSNFMVEQIDADAPMSESECWPHRCLAPRYRPEGIRRLRVSTVRRETPGGKFYPQFSLKDYFAAMLAVQANSLACLGSKTHYLPVRRFNPAALIATSGRSILAQIMKVSRSLIIEDVDLEPKHLKQHREQFSLAGTAAVFCTGDGFKTEAKYYVVTSPASAEDIRGERLW